jgi:hypothetical protein
MSHVIFYSWQSDLANSTNRSFILDALNKAVDNLANDDDLTIEPVLDRDTAGVPGSPDIGQTIFSKIEKATAFVCDISIINSSGAADRKTPNPNVLIELGFALHALGQNKVIMVMNTAHGGPELLPFDLRQKRVSGYDAKESDEDKATKRRDFARVLTDAIKAILLETQKQQSQTVSESILPSAEACAAVTAGRADQTRKVSAFMKWLSDELKKLDPHALPGEADENLVNAIDGTMPLVQEFEKVVDIISAVNSEDSAGALFKGFELIQTMCYPPENIFKSYRDTDFDLFKFISTELFIIFVAYLMRDERWKILDKTLNQHLYIRNSRGNHMQVFRDLKHYIGLLDDTRKKRIGQRRLSISADILKQRREADSLSSKITLEEFKDADMMLLFKGYKGDLEYWFPPTAVYICSHVPRFLVEAMTQQGSKHLAEILGLTTAPQLREYLNVVWNFMSKAIINMGGGPSFRNFDLNKIADF